MPRFAHFKILTKILTLLALLAMISLGTTIFATGKMRYIDNTYGDLIDGPESANLAIARANRNLVYINRSLYRLLTEVTESGTRQALKEISDTDGFFGKQIKAAVRGMPSKQTEIKKIADDYQSAISGVCAETIRFGTSINEEDKKQAAVQMREKCDPALNAVMDAISELTNEIIKINDKASDDALAVTNATIKYTYILVLGGLAFVVALTAYLIRVSVSKPIKQIAHVLEELAKENFAIKIGGVDRKDEVGDIAKAALVFRDQGQETARLRAEQEQAKIEAEHATQAALVAMADAIEAAAGQALTNVQDRTAAMTRTATEMSGSAARTGRSAESAAAAASQTLATSQTVASAADQLAASISEIGNQVGDSATAAGHAVTAGQKTRAAIEALTEQVSRIGAVADLIRNIAGRTNLLALNATIEAARAGDAGKGFAVVAGEVKSLATQTANSTQEITRHINEVRNATNEAVAAVQRIEQTIHSIETISTSVASAVDIQATATLGIAANMTDTASAARDMSSRITEVSSEAEQTERHAASVRENAAALEQAVTDLGHAVIRVVRTSTVAVNRRQAQRYPVDLPCRINAEGGNYDAKLADLSETGARVVSAPPLKVGTTGTIVINGLPTPLSFVVRNFDDTEALHLHFAENEDARSAIVALLGRMQQRLVA